MYRFLAHVSVETALLLGLLAAWPEGSSAPARLPAFPGAAGFGAYATGGPGGAVYHVTDLDDSGPGSFRDGVSMGHRIVVFDIGGYIALKSPVGVHSDITIAGQAAPVDTPPDLLKIPRPAIPHRAFKITDYGAVGDGKRLNTPALKAAVEACSNAGGGTVLVPRGRFLTGPFALRSSMELRIEKDATLLISDNVADFVLRGNRFENCITADDCHDVAITGSGTIDGQGAFWWTHYVKAKNAPPDTPDPAHRPFMVVLTRCNRVLIQDVSLTNSPSFHLAPSQCRDVTIERVRITAPEHAPNTDGIDPSGWNFLISHCAFDVGDDCIAVKPSGPGDAVHPSCQNFLIADCTFMHGHGMSIGGQTPGGLRNLTVRHCTFQSTEAGIRMKANRGSGGLVENLSYEDLTMKDVKVAILITSYYPRIPGDPGDDPAQQVSGTTPIWRHIRITNVTSEGGQVAGRIIGLAEMPVSDVVLSRVRLAAEKGMEIVHARGIRFVDSQVNTKAGAPVSLDDAEVTGLNPPAGR